MLGAPGPLCANTSSGRFSGDLAFSSCPLGSLAFDHPMLGRTPDYSLPGDHCTDGLCWRFGVKSLALLVVWGAGGALHCLLSFLPFLGSSHLPETSSRAPLPFLDPLKRAISPFPCWLHPGPGPEHPLYPQGHPLRPPCSGRQWAGPESPASLPLSPGLCRSKAA